MVDDFSGADLRGADLTGIRLDGVRWSDDTRWPDDLVERIRRDSVPLGGGIYEIRPSTTASEDLASAPPR
jgi:Pentapeptide repeats (8 copies)